MQHESDVASASSLLTPTRSMCANKESSRPSFSILSAWIGCLMSCDICGVEVVTFFACVSVCECECACVCVCVCVCGVSSCAEM
jgi:hypothetical protein